MRECLDVVDQRRAAQVADLCRERRLQPRHPPPALHRLEHRRLLAADVCARADDELHRRASFRDGGAKPGASRGVLLAQVDVRFVRLAEAHRHLEPFEEKVRAQLHDVPVLDRSRLAFVGVHDHDARPRLPPHGFPLEEGREPGATHPGQPGGLEAREHFVLSELRRPADLVGVEQEAVGRVRDAPGDLVAVQHDGREVAVAEARNLDGAVPEQLARAGAVADRTGADPNRVHGHLQEGVEGDDLVHVPPAQVHPVGERIREVRRDRPDLAP
jgi:hypothetical protein